MTSAGRYWSGGNPRRSASAGRRPAALSPQLPESRMRPVHLVGLLLPFVSALPLAAQGEDELRDAFEGRMVTVKLDMPATSKGVNIRPQEHRPLDTREYAD